MEFDWVVGWVGLWVQSFHFAMGWVGLKKWTHGQLWVPEDLRNQGIAKVREFSGNFTYKNVKVAHTRLPSVGFLS